MKLPIDECPHCGGVVFYRKDCCTSWYSAINIPGVGVRGIHDYVKLVTGEWWYCEDCHKKVFKDEEVE